MQSEKLLICDDCFDYLARKNTSTASFWSYLCTLYTNKLTPKKATSQYDNRFKMLEEEGFLLSTEAGKTTLAIALLGCNTARQVICLNKHVSDNNVWI